MHLVSHARTHPRTANKPRIGITMGDAAGIGPEIIVKALADKQVVAGFEPVVVGDVDVLRNVAAKLGTNITFAKDSTRTSDDITVAGAGEPLSGIEIGKLSAAAGRASGKYIEKAVHLWRAGEIDAVATAPINKEALGMGGYNFPGHTEFLAELTGTTRFAMSFFAGDLRVVLLSTHLSLLEAVEVVRKERLEQLIVFADSALSHLLGRSVKLAVAGLNPHASENGMFGSEEADEIEPAVRSCVSRGIDVSGPYSPDTIFLRGFRGEFDAVVACYHDQATIPVKAFSFGSAVNVTLGLPFVRTSVDHGTAFDIAGQGVADASSMKAAMKLAAELARISLAMTDSVSG